MHELSLISKLQDFSDQASSRANEYSGVIGSIQEFIVQNFGENGLIATYIVLATIALVIIMKVAKITFATLKYLVIPSLALAFIGTMFVPYTFFALLPVTVTACSLVLLVKG